MDTVVTSTTQRNADTGLASRLQVLTDRLHEEVSRLSCLQPSSQADHQLMLLRQEVVGMGQLIANTRAEIAGLLPTGTAHSHLTSASDELDAVVSATERAAVEIMVAAENAQEAAQRLRQAVAETPEAKQDLDTIEGAAIDIFMACSFQDLTGQRIRKVVQALTYIEKRVAALTMLWQGQPPTEAPEMAEWDAREDAHLLHGPNEDGLQQDHIDALLHGPATDTTASQDEIDSLFR